MTLAAPALLVLTFGAPALAQTASPPVTVVANIAFHSDELMNLHHFLYAWAWYTRIEGRPLSQRLAAVPTATLVVERHAAAPSLNARERQCRP